MVDCKFCYGAKGSRCRSCGPYPDRVAQVTAWWVTHSPTATLVVAPPLSGIDLPNVLLPRLRSTPLSLRPFAVPFPLDGIVTFEIDIDI